MAENTEVRLTLETWADIVIERWEKKIYRLGIRRSGKLVQSFSQMVRTQANGNPQWIRFAFNHYGRFVDMGTGRGVSHESVQLSNRRARPWYSKTFFSQLEKLKDILEEKYGIKAQYSIIQEIKKTE